VLVFQWNFDVHLCFVLFSHSTLLLIIVTFGSLKAIFNVFVGTLADTYGRKIICVYGWILSCTVPALILAANDWTLVIGATALLG
jgi:MFS family permease